tara:strand:+ start:227 stop:1594 length:1368 start_codon:yes stop_codon:yes gene_type:complete
MNKYKKNLYYIIKKMADEIFVAIKNNDLKKVLELTSSGMNFNYTMEFSYFGSRSPLSFAAYYGSKGVIEHLLKAGADPNYYQGFDIGPLRQAIQTRDSDIVKMFIDAGADVNGIAKHTRPSTSLLASMHSRPESTAPARIDVIKMLLKAGANPNICGKRENPALHEILSSKKPLKTKVEIAELLIGAGADVNAKNYTGMTPLHYAKNKTLIKLLIENDADPRIANKRGKAIIDSPGVKQVYMEYIMSKVKLANAKQRLAFATMLIDPKHDDKPEAVIAGICQALDMPPFDTESKDKADEILNRQLQQELQKEIKQKLKKEMTEKAYKSLKEQFPGEPIDDMIDFYRRQLQNPNLSPEHRKELRRKKRTRKNRQGISLGSSDLSSSRNSRSSPSEDLRDAIKMSIREARSNKSSSSRKSRSLNSSEEFDLVERKWVMAKTGSKKKKKSKKKSNKSK